MSRQDFSIQVGKSFIGRSRAVIASDPVSVAKMIQVIERHFDFDIDAKSREINSIDMHIQEAERLLSRLSHFWEKNDYAPTPPTSPPKTRKAESKPPPRPVDPPTPRTRNAEQQEKRLIPAPSINHDIPAKETNISKTLSSPKTTYTGLITPMTNSNSPMNIFVEKKKHNDATPIVTHYKPGSESRGHRYRRKFKLRPGAGLLFARKTDSSYVKLACPFCHRDRFVNLLGFSNHCRILHKHNFQDFQELIDACGVPVTPGEMDDSIPEIDLAGPRLVNGQGAFQTPKKEQNDAKSSSKKRKSNTEDEVTEEEDVRNKDSTMKDNDQPPNSSQIQESSLEHSFLKQESLEVIELPAEHETEATSSTQKSPPLTSQRIVESQPPDFDQLHASEGQTQATLPQTQESTSQSQSNKIDEVQCPDTSTEPPSSRQSVVSSTQPNPIVSTLPFDLNTFGQLNTASSDGKNSRLPPKIKKSRVEKTDNQKTGASIIVESTPQEPILLSVDSDHETKPIVLDSILSSVIDTQSSPLNSVHPTQFDQSANPQSPSPHSRAPGRFESAQLEPPPLPIEQEILPQPEFSLEDENTVSRFYVRKKVICGNTSIYVPPEKRQTGFSYTHKWSAYVKGPAGDESINKFVRKVRFFLHPSYRPHDIVEVSKPPFSLTRRGWGEFPIRIQIHLQESLGKPIDIIHNIQLDKQLTGSWVLASEKPFIIDLDRRAYTLLVGDSVPSDPAPEIKAHTREDTPTTVEHRQMQEEHPSTQVAIPRYEHDMIHQDSGHMATETDAHMTIEEYKDNQNHQDILSVSHSSSYPTVAHVTRESAPEVCISDDTDLQHGFVKYEPQMVFPERVSSYIDEDVPEFFCRYCGSAHLPESEFFRKQEECSKRLNLSTLTNPPNNFELNAIFVSLANQSNRGNQLIASMHPNSSVERANEELREFCKVNEQISLAYKDQHVWLRGVLAKLHVNLPKEPGAEPTQAEDVLFIAGIAFMQDLLRQSVHCMKEERKSENPTEGSWKVVVPAHVLSAVRSTERFDFLRNDWLRQGSSSDC